MMADGRDRRRRPTDHTLTLRTMSAFCAGVTLQAITARTAHTSSISILVSSADLWPTTVPHCSSARAELICARLAVRAIGSAQPRRVSGNPQRKCGRPTGPPQAVISYRWLALGTCADAQYCRHGSGSGRGSGSGVLEDDGQRWPIHHQPDRILLGVHVCAEVPAAAMQ